MANERIYKITFSKAHLFYLNVICFCCFAGRRKSFLILFCYFTSWKYLFSFFIYTYLCFKVSPTWSYSKRISLLSCAIDFLLQRFSFHSTFSPSSYFISFNTIFGYVTCFSSTLQLNINCNKWCNVPAFSSCKPKFNVFHRSFRTFYLI